MSDMQTIEERLHGFVAVVDDADWQDVLRRAGERSSEAVPPFRRRRIALALAVCIAVAALAVGFSGLLGSSSRFAPTKTGPQVGASGCASLRSRLQSVTSNGQSVVEAVGILAAHPHTVGQSLYWEMRLTHVQTLSGKTRPSFSGWIQTSPNPAPDAADAPGLWAPNGQLVAIVTPSRVARSPLGPLLSTAPIIGTNVILSSAQCWADTSLTTSEFNGPLSEIPGSNGYALAQQAGGFGAYPLHLFVSLVH